MPVTKRRRPVVEEIIETPKAKVEAVSHVQVEEAVPSKDPEKTTPPKQEFTQTVQEVASYDEPPMVDKKPETAAREFLSESSEERGRKPNMRFIFVVTILTALIVGFIAGGVYVYVSGVNSSHDTVIKPTTAPSEAPVQTSTPSPKPTVKLDSFTVNVLNGSGIIGAAGKVKDSLTAGGFSVSGTGNAANYSFAKTVIQAKASVATEVIEAVKAALKDYEVTVGEALLDTSKYDIVVTAGKK